MVAIGRIVNDYLDGSWSETCDGVPRKGEAKVMRRIGSVDFADGFRGGYRVMSHVPKKDGTLTIELDL